MSKQIKIAITGTIGSGKSEVSNYLRDKGYFVFDCDEENRKLLNKGELGYIKVKETFPECFINDDLDKAKLANLVFTDIHAKERLESIMHPLILERLNQCQNDVLFAEVPLLFEVNWDKYFDYSILVISDGNIVLKRLVDRGLDPIDAKNRINNQMSVDDKKTRTNQIIYNNGSLADLHNNIDNWLKEYVG